MLDEKRFVVPTVTLFFRVGAFMMLYSYQFILKAKPRNLGAIFVKIPGIRISLFSRLEGLDKSFKS